MKLQFYTTVTNGRLTSTWQNAVNSFEGQRVAVTIQKAKKKRSNPQNAYFHGCVVPIVTNAMLDAGIRTSNTETKEMLKRKFLSEDLPFADGQYLERTKNTSELSTSEFNDFIAQVQQFAAEWLSVEVPDPNEQLVIL
jgi:hypothetical protein